MTALALFAPRFALAAPPRQVNYVVTITDAAKKRFRVTAQAEGVTGDSISFAIPAWSPGWYVLTNAYKNVENVSATDKDGKPLIVSRMDKYLYQVATKKKRLGDACV